MNLEQLKAKLHGQFSRDLPAMLEQYLENVYTDGDLEDQRKALYMGFEVLGMRSREKVENLPVVNVTFNGVSAAISVDVAPKAPEDPTVIEADVELVELADLPAPKDKPSSTLDAMRASLDAFTAK